MPISEDMLVQLLQFGGQSVLPLAALLRALYSGTRGKLPEGLAQVVGASLLAGATSMVGVESPTPAPTDIRALLTELLSNSVFVAGILGFAVVYLVRFTGAHLILDAIVGAGLGAAGWAAWVYLLENAAEWWWLPAAIAVGALGFVILRRLMTQLFRLLRLARILITLGLLVVIAAGIFLLIQNGGFNFTL